MSTKREQLYWHFLPADKRLRYGRKTLIRTGHTAKVKGELVLCEHGLHASKRAIDALRYAPGPIICRVKLGGTILHGDNKSVATERTVIAMADATTVLHEFACWCATRALKAAKVTDARCWNAVAAKLKWLRGEATDDELAAARSAAESALSAALSAAWSAAESAALSAAWSAARSALSAAESAAESAARSAARSAAESAESAARSAAESAHNRNLESRLKKLLGTI